MVRLLVRHCSEDSYQVIVALPVDGSSKTSIFGGNANVYSIATALVLSDYESARTANGCRARVSGSIRSHWGRSKLWRTRIKRCWHSDLQRLVTASAIR